MSSQEAFYQQASRMRFKRVQTTLVPAPAKQNSDVTEAKQDDVAVSSAQGNDDVDDELKAKKHAPAVSSDSDTDSSGSSDSSDDSSDSSGSESESETEKDALKPVEEMQLHSDVITVSSTQQGQDQGQLASASAESFKQVDEVELSNDVIVVDSALTSSEKTSTKDSAKTWSKREFGRIRTEFL